MSHYLTPLLLTAREHLGKAALALGRRTVPSAEQKMQALGFLKATLAIVQEAIKKIEANGAT